MSRYNTFVPLKEASEVFGFPLTKAQARLIESGAVLTVEVAHGYDAPCTSYFCDLEPDCETGFYYGGVGLTTRVDKGEYVRRLEKLGMVNPAAAVSLDIPY